MKILKSIVTLILFGTLAMAQNSVDEQIEAIQNASTKEEKVALVNEFKRTLSKLSGEDRATAINNFRSGMQADATGTKNVTQTQDRSHLNQMKQTHNTQREQNINQNQNMIKNIQQKNIDSNKMDSTTHIGGNNNMDGNTQNKFGGR